MPTVTDVQSFELNSSTDDNVELGIDPVNSKPPTYTGTPLIICGVQRGVTSCGNESSYQDPNFLSSRV
jgi:hypothetical protein